MPNIVYKLIICLIASLFAGIGTGFVGMSAAVAITPLMMGFLGMTQFEATAIALASDVLASAGAAYMYSRHKNVDVKNGLILLITVLIFTFAGTIVAYYVPNEQMEMGTLIAITCMGLKMLIFPHARLGKAKEGLTKRHKKRYSILFGALIGFVCGFVGAGGGMLLLLVLTVFLGFETHKAVGTSVFVMTFSAFTGSAFHILYQGVIAPTPATDITGFDFVAMGFCIVFTMIFAMFASRSANHMKEKTLNLFSGGMLLVIALTVLVIATKSTGNFSNIRMLLIIVVDALALKFMVKKKI